MSTADISLARPTASASNASEALVRARSLYKGYGQGDRRAEALMGVSLTIGRAEIVGVLGPNGAGKTTLISILEGLMQADSGEARVLSQDVGTREGSARVKPMLGVAMQNSVLPPLLKVSELLQFKRSLHPRSRDPEQLLQALGLQEKRDALYRSLSGGQQQRVVVAMALVGDPEVLFLDEPTSQLDPQARRAVWDLLADQRRSRGAGILVTTHQMEEAERLCDQVLVLDHGRVIASGRPRELIAEHCPDRQIEFATTAHAARTELQDLDARLEVDAPRPDGLVPVKLRSARLDTVLAELLRRQGAGTLVLDELRITTQTLEDVFIKLTGRSIRG